MVLETYKTENTKEIKYNIPISICDYCSKYFYEGDYRLVQISNECIDLFKLEFCSIECLQEVEKNYHIVRLFEFEKHNKKTLVDMVKEDDLMNILVINFVEFIIDIENRKPIKSYEIIDNYFKLYNKNKDYLTDKETKYINFIRENNIFNLF
jgi:hypothetical protein